MRTLRRRLTSKEMTEWLAFFELEPWGTKPADQRAELIAWAALYPHVKAPGGGSLRLSDMKIQRDDGALRPATAADGTDEVALERFFSKLEGGRP